MSTDHKTAPAAAPIQPEEAVAAHATTLGAFKPVGHVLLSFANAQASAEAYRALLEAGLSAADIRRYSDREMLQQAESDLARVSPIADFGQEANLLRFHRQAALAGYHWLLVKTGNEAQARQIARSAQAHGAELAQYYGHFIIEELIRHPGDQPQRTESPARGLDPGLPRR